MLRLATVEATSERCLIYRVFGVWFVPRVDSNRWIFLTLIAGNLIYKDMDGINCPLDELLYHI